MAYPRLAEIIALERNKNDLVSASMKGRFMLLIKTQIIERAVTLIALASNSHWISWEAKSSEL